VKDRFGVPVRSSIFRFLHLPKRGASVPKTTTSTTNEIKSVRDPVLRITVGIGAAAAGVLSLSEDGLAVAAGVAASGGVGASAAGGLTVSEDGSTVAAGAVAVVAFVTESL
jgi:hypothetical protein